MAELNTKTYELEKCLANLQAELAKPCYRTFHKHLQERLSDVLDQLKVETDTILLMRAQGRAMELTSLLADLFPQNKA